MKRAAVCWLGGTCVLVVLALTLDGYAADLYRKLLLTVTLCVGFNFLFGVAGQLAFSHVAFYGIGAYSVVILAFTVGLPMPLAILGAVAICFVLAVVVAIPSTRLEGFYLALATLAFAQLFNVVLLQGGDVTGGPQGLSGYSAGNYFGLPTGGGVYTIVIVAIFLGTLAVLLLLDNSWFGRSCRAIRDNPDAAEAMGVDIFRTKVIVFALTSTLAGVAGVSYAFVDNYLSPLVFNLEFMFLLLFMVIVGGSGRHAGAIVGAVLLFLAPELLEEWVGRHYILVFGLIVVLAILFQRKGLIGIYDQIVARMRSQGTARLGP